MLAFQQAITHKKSSYDKEEPIKICTNEVIGVFGQWGSRLVWNFLCHLLYFFITIILRILKKLKLMVGFSKTLACKKKSCDEGDLSWFVDRGFKGVIATSNQFFFL